jgi:uroporphyrinogen-III decarboxylase
MDKIINSKRLVRGVFESAALPRLPFIPWVFTHAARLEQIPLRRIFAEPTQYTRCLQNTRKLYGYDAIISCFDSSLETEICGSPVTWRGDYEAPAISPNPGFDFNRLRDIDVEMAGKAGRFGTVIESLRRIKLVAGPNLAVVAVIHGPLALTAGLTGRDPLQKLTESPEEATVAIEAAAGLLTKIVQIYCQLELDVIAIVDRLTVDFPAAHLSWLKSIFSPVVNIIRFYNAFSVLVSGEAPPDSVANLLGLDFDGVVASGIDTDTWQKMKGGRSCVLGKAIPARILNSSPVELRAYLEEYIPERIEPGVFLTTDWEVPSETPPDNLHLVMNMLSKQ